MKFIKKFALAKWPRPKFKAPRLRLPARRGFPRPRLKRASSKGRIKREHLVIGGGFAGFLALAALGGLVAWPRLRPPPPAAAQTNSDAAKADGSKGDASWTDGSRIAPPMVFAAKPPPPKVEEKTAKAPTAPAPTVPAGKETSQAQAAAVSAPPPPGEAEQLARRLQDVENRVAEGDPAAYRDMPTLARAIAQRFVDLPPKTWADARNARALVLYLLSGGNSAVGRRVLNEHTAAPSEVPLAKGAIAYLEGIDCAERDALLDADPRRLDVALGAQVAYVQSTLLLKYDRASAIGKLDLARLLAPGGLVDEAALRREASLLSETTQFDKFAELARQYWSRFRRSPYADNFLRQFVVDVERVSVRIKVEQWAPLDEFMDSLAVDRRRSFYLAMAQTAAASNNSAFADFAARRALALAAPDGVERQRALLYRAAVDVAVAPANGELLREIDRAKLPRTDQPLYDAVAMVAARIVRAPEKDFTAPPPGAGDLSGGEFARAEASLREADAALAAERKSMERQSR